MSDYTPSTEEVREEYWAASGQSRREGGAWGEFDRWLAAERAKAAVQSLRDYGDAMRRYGLPYNWNSNSIAADVHEWADTLEEQA